MREGNDVMAEAMTDPVPVLSSRKIVFIYCPVVERSGFFSLKKAILRKPSSPIPYNFSSILLTVITPLSISQVISCSCLFIIRLG